MVVYKVREELQAGNYTSLILGLVYLWTLFTSFVRQKCQVQKLLRLRLAKSMLPTFTNGVKLTAYTEITGTIGIYFAFVYYKST